MRSTIPDLSCAARPCPHLNGTAYMRDCAWPDCALISADRDAGHDPRDHYGHVMAGDVIVRAVATWPTDNDPRNHCGRNANRHPDAYRIDKLGRPAMTACRTARTRSGR